MPKSKRNRVVSLTKTTKKGIERKKTLVDNLREAASEHASVYVFRYADMRNERMKELREVLKGKARFFMGSNKVMQVALGREPSDECREEMHRLSARVRGNCGVLATNMTRAELEEAFSGVEEENYARAGKLATRAVQLPEGPLRGPSGEPLSHTLEPALRQCGLPTKLNKGVVELIAETNVCECGKPLSVSQARILKTLGIKMARFKLWLDSVWANDSFEIISGDGGDSDEDVDEDDASSDGDDARANSR